MILRCIAVLFLFLLPRFSYATNPPAVEKTLSAEASKIKVLGGLIYCENNELHDELFKAIGAEAFTTMYRGPQEDWLPFDSLMNYISIQSIGVAYGIELSPRTKEEKDRFCETPTDLANDFLQSKDRKAHQVP